MIWLWGSAWSSLLVFCCPWFDWPGLVVALQAGAQGRVGVRGCRGNLSKWAVQSGVTWCWGDVASEMQSCWGQQLEGTVAKLQLPFHYQ